MKITIKNLINVIKEEDQLISKLYIYILKPIYWRFKLRRFGKGSVIHNEVIILNPINVSIGNNFKIWHRSFLAVGTKGKVEIGSNGHLGVEVYLNAIEGKIIIGNNVAIAPKSQIYSYSNHYSNSA